MQNKKTTLIAFVAVLITLGAVWFNNRALTPRDATWDDVLAEAKNGGYRLITAAELSERYRGREEHFAGGYPPGVGIPDRTH